MKLLALVIASSAIANAQLMFFEDGFQQIMQPKRAMIADVTATLTAHSPWGDITKVETGKYWRSSKGQILQQDAHGHSLYVYLQEPRLHAEIDHELKLITAMKDIRERPRAGQDITRRIMSDTKPKKIGEAVLEGYRVTIRQGQWNGLTVEAWSSDEWKLPLLVKYATATTEFEQRYHNIQRVEPEASVFEFPLGFRMHTTFMSTLPGAAGTPACMHMTDSVIGQPGERPYGRVFGTRESC